MAQQPLLKTPKTSPSAFDLQREASNPDASAWVSASAGTGKTKVLTDRILRLLLAGVEPRKILALTFTKAAAAEMRERLLDRLRHWAFLPFEALQEDLSALIGAPPDEGDDEKARGLFDLVLDAGDRMKIVTLHSFCQSLLAQFPFEAGVPFGFMVADDESARLLLNEALASVLKNEESSDDLSILTEKMHPEIFKELLEELLRKRAFLKESLDTGLKVQEKVLKETLGLRSMSQEDLFNDFWRTSLDRISQVESLVGALQRGSDKDREKASFFESWVQILKAEDREEGMVRLASYGALFLTKDGMIRKTLATQKALSADPQSEAFLNREAERLFHFEQERRSLKIFELSRAILSFGIRVYECYQTLKDQQKLLDYDDLVDKAAALLREESLSDWVLFKLDGGIDHLLIDEAQDTNARQWAIIDAVVQEFFAGEGAREENRTLFVVGDEKQAIYSFQGTDPKVFAAMKGYYEACTSASRKHWADVSMSLSFRSSEPILEVVDEVFSSPEVRRNLTALGDGDIVHFSHKNHLGGAVEIWPLVRDEKEEEIASVEDRLIPRQIPPSADRRVAKRLAQTIKSRIDHKKFIESRGRPIQAEDVLILLRKRGRFMEEVIRALKREGVPVAGVDRMILTEHLAVQDLCALARFLLFPRDDMSLACVLKSPLFEWNEEDVMALCFLRKEGASLWQTLQKEKGRKGLWAETEGELRGLLRQVDYLTPYQLFSEMLERRGGRTRFLSRFGAEVADPLEEFMSVTLDYQLKEVPSLQRFLSWIEERSLEVKRELSRNNQKAVRVMTVHGAKGLQAPVVFVCDGVQKPVLKEALLSNETEDILLWSPPQDEETTLTRDWKARKREAMEAEYHRLLYVALTRAEEHLIICGWQGSERTTAGTWYETLLSTLQRIGKACEDPWGEGWVYEKKGHVIPLTSDDSKEKEAAPRVPEWLFEKVSLKEEKKAWHSVTDLSREEDSSAGHEETSFSLEVPKSGRKGQSLHRLLEVLPALPRDRREDVGKRILGEERPYLSEEVMQEYLNAVFSLLDSPALKSIFEAEALTEQAFVGTVDGKTVLGQVDRLVFDGDGVTIIDYKTHASPDTVSPKERSFYQNQLRTYAKLVKDLYPTYRIKAALLWTETAQLEEIPL